MANPFVRYELHIAESGSDDWGWLFSGKEQFWQSPLYTLDTTRLADGFYDMRLRTVYRDGNYDEYYVSRLQVANQTPPTVLLKQGAVSNVGTTPAVDDFVKMQDARKKIVEWMLTEDYGVKVERQNNIPVEVMEAYGFPPPQHP
jgi:hypothetical protein